MKKEKKLKLTEDYLYDNCAYRIRRKMEEMNRARSENGQKPLKAKDFLPSDRAMFSRIINKRITSRNAYLIQYATLCELYETMNFKNNQEIIWGSEEEIESYLPVLFQFILFDLLEPTSSMHDEIHKLLCSYIPYARYSAYRQIFFDHCVNTKSTSFDSLYHFDEYSLGECIESITSDAIQYIYDLCHKELLKSFLEFTKENDSFSYWDSKMMKWINNELRSILSPYTPKKDSIGLRIMELIISDAKLVFAKPNNSASFYEQIDYRKLIQATDVYIDNLESLCNRKNDL